MIRPTVILPSSGLIGVDTFRVVHGRAGIVVALGILLSCFRLVRFEPGNRSYSVGDRCRFLRRKRR